MPDYLFPIESNEGTRRDILREIDAGELDEHYLIKNADDYGKCASPHPLTALRMMLGKLFGVRPSVARKQIEVKRVVRSNIG